MKAFTLWTLPTLDRMEFLDGATNRYGIYMTAEIFTCQALHSGNMYIYRTKLEGGDIKSRPVRHD